MPSPGWTPPRAGATPGEVLDRLLALRRDRAPPRGYGPVPIKPPPSSSRAARVINSARPLAMSSSRSSKIRASAVPSVPPSLITAARAISGPGMSGAVIVDAHVDRRHAAPEPSRDGVVGGEIDQRSEHAPMRVADDRDRTRTRRARAFEWRFAVSSRLQLDAEPCVKGAVSHHGGERLEIERRRAPRRSARRASVMASAPPCRRLDARSGPSSPL